VQGQPAHDHNRMQGLRGHSNPHPTGDSPGSQHRFPQISGLRAGCRQRGGSAARAASHVYARGPRNGCRVLARCFVGAGRSRGSDSQRYTKLRASDPRTIAYVNLNLPFETSDLLPDLAHRLDQFKHAESYSES